MNPDLPEQEITIRYSFFNFLNFILGMAYGFLGINIRRLETEGEHPSLEDLPQAPQVGLGK